LFSWWVESEPKPLAPGVTLENIDVKVLAEEDPHGPEEAGRLKI
jgi:hypothetical protein